MTRIRNLPGEFESEAAFRKAAIKRLTDNGYEVRQTSTNKKMYRQFRGLGDTFIRNPDWEDGVWKQVEFKLGSHWKWSCDEQEIAYREGSLLVFWWICDVENFMVNDKKKVMA